MKKAIVTTTINSPTTATKRFAEIADRDGWEFIIVGDTKTPHNEYQELAKQHQNVFYFTPEAQETLHKELSDTIGWKSIRRRNMGFLYAYRKGAEIVATVDDDNIPYDSWGTNVVVGQTVTFDCYEPECGVFDALSVTNINHVWHRGFPIEYVPTRHRVTYVGKRQRKVLVQADLWDGDPDIDAIARLSLKPLVKFQGITGPYGSTAIGPFNSQNTFLAREVLPYYSVLPHIGRMDDIWGAYILQHFFPDSVVFMPPSVYQERNVQDLIKNLEDEIIGYRYNLKLLENLERFEEHLPEATQAYWKVYREACGR